MLYGLDAIVLTKTDIQSLDTYYKSLLRGILSLREGVASEAIFLLSGLVPVEGEIHLRMLTTYGAITRLHEGAPLRNVAMRQMSLPHQKRGSWFQYIKEKASMYGIAETLLGSLINPWKPEEWKRFVRETVYAFWFDRLLLGALQKSTLSHMDLSLMRRGIPHHIWPTRGCSSRQRVAASFRAKMLSGSYILQANRARFNQFEVKTTCPLCSAPKENLVHFVLICPALDKARSHHMSRIWKYLEEMSIPIPSSAEEKCTLLMNCGTSYKCRLCKGAGYKPTSRRSRTKSNSSTDGTEPRDKTSISTTNTPRYIDRNSSRLSRSSSSVCVCRKLNNIMNNMCLDLHNMHQNVLASDKTAPEKKRRK